MTPNARCLPVVFLAILVSGLFSGGCQQPVVAPPAAMAAARPVTSAAESAESRYVFGWGELPANLAKPRGGTTQGGKVTLAPARPLPLPEIATAADGFARDRAAILALAGDYRVSFNFMETMGLVPDYRPGRPYHSWATEQVRVIEDHGKFISLQHTLVMIFTQPDGSVSAPMLTKHWRQDWTYEDTDLHTFRGGSTWARQAASPAEAKGAWSQAVFQVDDSPRYEALGRWEHQGNLSVWTSARAWRPLPRREFSVRDDYDVLQGTHRIALTPTGWLHEQQNWKRAAGVRSSPEGAPAEPVYVAAEFGLDRYERITSPAMTPADDYWRKTGAYWALVRAAWRDLFKRNERVTLKAEVAGKKLFQHHFEYAERLEAGQPFVPAEAARQIADTLESFLEKGS